MNVYEQINSFQNIYLQLLLFFVLFSFVLGQPRNQEAELFECGSKLCERWGYNTCISEDGRRYCLPCYYDQFAGHCGTKNELPGCNLYCTELAVAKTIRKMMENYTSDSDLPHKNNAALNKELALYKWLVVCFGISFILVVFFCSRWICRRRVKTKEDLENSGGPSEFNSKSTLASKASNSSGIGTARVSMSSLEQSDERKTLLEEATDQPETEAGVVDDTSDSTHKPSCRDQRLNGVNPTNEPGEHDNAYG